MIVVFNAYLIITGFMFMIMGIAWDSSDLLNGFLKAFMFVMAILSICLYPICFTESRRYSKHHLME